MTDFTRLSTDWTSWMRWFHMSNVSASVQNDEYASFMSDDGSYFLHKEQDWWVIDYADDRGKRTNNIASFSNFELAEKYLISQWAFAVTNAPELGPELYARGMNPDITVRPTEDEWTVELESPVGRARLGEPGATIFSYLMDTPTNRIEQRMTGSSHSANKGDGQNFAAYPSSNSGVLRNDI